MSYINWNETYEIGFKQIDDQHKSLVELLNELHDAQSSGTGQHLVKESLIKLMEYTLYHFETEKELFEQYQYPKTEEHLIEHDYFVQQVKIFQKDIEKKNLLLSLKTIDFLKDWTITHILGTDQEFGNFVRSQEIGDVF